MMSKIAALILLIFFAYESTASISPSNFEKAKECLGARESNNNYHAVNRFGYLGRYQFGAAALEDIGFIKRGCYKRYRNRVPSKCWIGKRGVKSRVNFLDNSSAQDYALNRFFNVNYKKLLSNKTLTKSSTQTYILQALFVSHLLGVKAAHKYFKKNINDKDGNGTTAREYSNLAIKCIGDTDEEAI